MPHAESHTEQEDVPLASTAGHCSTSTFDGDPFGLELIDAGPPASEAAHQFGPSSAEHSIADLEAIATNTTAFSVRTTSEIRGSYMTSETTRQDHDCDDDDDGPATPSYSLSAFPLPPDDLGTLLNSSFSPLSVSSEAFGPVTPVLSTQLPAVSQVAIVEELKETPWDSSLSPTSMMASEKCNIVSHLLDTELTDDASAVADVEDDIVENPLPESFLSPMSVMSETFGPVTPILENEQNAQVTVVGDLISFDDLSDDGEKPSMTSDLSVWWRGEGGYYCWEDAGEEGDTGIDLNAVGARVVGVVGSETGELLL